MFQLGPNPSKKASFSTIPVQFMSENVTPLHKRLLIPFHTKILPGNYRYISLTVIACKIMESIVKTEIETFNLLSKQQHRFVKNMSCTTNLLKTLDFISSSLNIGCQVDVILLDFAKAFDTVPHKRFLLKLSSYRISG